MTINHKTMEYNFSHNESREIKIGDSIRWSTINMINHYGSNNSAFITLGISGNRSLQVISQKFNPLMRAMSRVMHCGIAVFGNAERSIHVHIVGVFLPKESKRAQGPIPLNSEANTSPSTPLPISKIRSLVKKAKSKARFGKVFDVTPIRSVEAVGGYMRRNFLKFDEFRRFTDFFTGKNLRGFRLYRVPSSLIVKPSQFSRHTEAASRYRQAMTGLAKAAGTPIGDIFALEQATGLSFKELRHVAFEICNSIPGLPKKFPARVFINALNEVGCNIHQFSN